MKELKMRAIDELEIQLLHAKLAEAERTSSDKIEKLKSELSEKVSVIKNHKSELELCRKLLSEKENEAAFLKEDRDHAAKQVRELQMQISNKQAEILRLESRNSELFEENNSLLEQIEKQKKVISECTQSNTELFEQVKSLEASLRAEMVEKETPTSAKEIHHEALLFANKIHTETIEELKLIQEITENLLLATFARPALDNFYQARANLMSLLKKDVKNEVEPTK